MLAMTVRQGVSALTTVFTVFASAPSAPLAVAEAGIAKYYAQGVFREVAANRNMAMRGDVHGYASVPDCSRIGKIVRASINGRAPERYQVLDCSAPRDLPRHRREGLVIEVDYESAKRHGFLRLGKARAVVYFP